MINIKIIFYIFFVIGFLFSNTSILVGQSETKNSTQTNLNSWLKQGCPRGYGTDIYYNFCWVTGPNWRDTFETEIETGGEVILEQRNILFRYRP